MSAPPLPELLADVARIAKAHQRAARRAGRDEVEELLAGTVSVSGDALVLFSETAGKALAQTETRYAVAFTAGFLAALELVVERWES